MFHGLCVLVMQRSGAISKWLYQLDVIVLISRETSFMQKPKISFQIYNEIWNGILVHQYVIFPSQRNERDIVGPHQCFTIVRLIAISRD